jgi:hypothetical protein
VYGTDVKMSPGAFLLWNTSVMRSVLWGGLKLTNEGCNVQMAGGLNFLFR